MKLKKFTPFLAGALVLVLTCVAAPAESLSGSGGAGSAADPVVTQSYVDQKYNQLLTMIQNMAQGQTAPSGSPDNAAASSYTPVSASAGQTIICGEGTEIILRSGAAVAYCQGENGLSDVTQAVDLTNGMKLTANHLLIVPRADGRGVSVTADAWFLIKGDYTIY
ncbi:MAG: hypothetical protein FWF44_05735 [Defluviitaleaceae bacterium]|nr:hypothetical protein [Defluviitaleaceae bacterium]